MVEIAGGLASQLTWPWPSGGMHSGDYPGDRFYESNRLHGDGHAETHGKPLQQVIVRWGTAYIAF